MIKKLQPLLLSLLIGFGVSASAAERGHAYVTNQDGSTSTTLADYYFGANGRVNLKAGANFATKLGGEAQVEYTVITQLGAAGDESRADAINNTIRGRLPTTQELNRRWVTANSGSIQRGVSAASAGDTVGATLRFDDVPLADIGELLQTGDVMAGRLSMRPKASAIGNPKRSTPPRCRRA